MTKEEAEVFLGSTTKTTNMTTEEAETFLDAVPVKVGDGKVITPTEPSFMKDVVGKTASEVWEGIKATPETAATLATGLTTFPLSVVGGIARTITTGKGTEGIKTQEQIAEAFTYQPESEIAQKAAELILTPIKYGYEIPKEFYVDKIKKVFGAETAASASLALDSLLLFLPAKFKSMWKKSKAKGVKESEFVKLQLDEMLEDVKLQKEKPGMPLTKPKEIIPERRLPSEIETTLRELPEEPTKVITLAELRKQKLEAEIETAKIAREKAQEGKIGEPLAKPKDVIPERALPPNYGDKLLKSLKTKEEPSLTKTIATKETITTKEAIAEKQNLKQQIMEGIESGEHTGAVRFGTVDELRVAIKNKKLPVSEEYGEIHAQPILGKDTVLAAYGDYSKHNMAMVFPEKYVRTKVDAHTSEVLIDPNVPLNEVRFFIGNQKKSYTYNELVGELGNKGIPVDLAKFRGIQTGVKSTEAGIPSIPDSMVWDLQVLGKETSFETPILEGKILKDAVEAGVKRKKAQYTEHELRKKVEITQAEIVKPTEEGVSTPLEKKPATPTLEMGGMQTVYEDISNATSKIIENAKLTPEITAGVKSAKNAMIEHDRNIRNAEFTSKQFEKVVEDAVIDKERQMLMVHSYEHKMKGKYWEQLTEGEKGIVKWAAKEKAKLDKYIAENDVLEMMPLSDKINHIYHHWINPKTGESYPAMYGKFSKGLPQAKQRVIPTYEVGIEKGMTPATTNLGKLIGLEWESATRANSARQLLKTQYGIKGDAEMSIVLRKGTPPQPIRMIERWDLIKKQGLEEGYIRYDNQFFDKPIVFKSSDGKTTILKGAVGVHKEIYPFLRSYIENPTYGKLSELNFATKSLKLGASLFHPVSLGMQELANLRVPFVHIPKGLRLIEELSPTVKLLHQEGLELFKGYEDLGYRNKFFDGGSALGKTGNVITWPIVQMRSFIFDYVQPGMKVSFADMQMRKLLPRYLKKAGSKLTAEEVMTAFEAGEPVPAAALQCARDVVLKADGHFSGEHYKRSLLETNRFMVKLYFTPEARVKWQAALLSPTWQREHLLVAKNVAKSFMPDSMIKKLGLAEMGPIKSQYRRYLLGGIMIIGAVDLWNYMSTQEMDGKGKHIWENPPGKGFAVRAWWDEPDYKVTDKNGKERTIKGGPAYIRPLKSLFEVAEWAHDPFKKVAYKLSPVVSAIGGQLFGMRGYEGIIDVPERAWDFITDVTTPIMVDQIIKSAKGMQRIESAILPFFGMPTSKVKKTKKKPTKLKELRGLSKPYE